MRKKLATWAGVVTVLALGAGAALAQSNYFSAAGYNPVAFGQWLIRVDGSPVGAAGSATITVPVAGLTLPGGPAFEPLSTDVPMAVRDGNDSETVTPSAVTCGASACSVTANFAKPHLGSYYLGSGDGGLEEAVNWADSHGGGVVAVTPPYAGPAISTLTGGNANTLVSDNRGGTFQWYTWRGSNYSQMWAISGTSVDISGNNIASLGCSGVSAAMVAGTVTVNAGCLFGSRPITLTEATKGGTQGFLSYTESGSQIVITSSSSSDTSTVAWAQN